MTLPSKNWDAIVIRRPGSKPHVLVSEGARPTRARFTLAHELGHLVLPWQFGSFFCHADATYVPNGEMYGLIEAEANQFASELLVPTEWLSGELLATRGVVPLAEGIIELANTAEVSPIVVALALDRTVGVAGRAWIRNSSTGQRYRAQALDFPFSPTTWKAAWDDDPSPLQALGAEVSTTSFGDYELQAVSFGSGASIPAPSEPGSLILAAIVSAYPPGLAASLKGQVSGIVGAANSQCFQDTITSGQAYKILQARCGGRSAQLQAVFDDPRFDEFLRATACELVERRRKQRDV